MAAEHGIQMNMTIGELAKRLGAEVRGAPAGPQKEITGIQPVDTAGESDLRFVTDTRHAAAAAKSGAGAVLVAAPIEGLAKPQLVVKDVNAALIETLNLFAPKLQPAVAGVDSSARIGTNVRLAQGVSVGPYAILEDNVQVGAGSVIGSPFWRITSRSVPAASSAPAARSERIRRSAPIAVSTATS
jgi:UDP-3-O-[3-hydroxymyristoyl] glucosamine N-acyltransferase